MRSSSAHRALSERESRTPVAHYKSEPRPGPEMESRADDTDRCRPD